MLNHILQGKVIKGEAVGRTIGFPTANLKLTTVPKVKPGVYAALITLNNQSFLGLAYYGPRYIFGQKPTLLKFICLILTAKFMARFYPLNY